MCETAQHILGEGFSISNLLKFKTHVSFEPAISRLGIYLRKILVQRSMCLNISGSICCMSEKLEAISVSINKVQVK